MDEDLVLREIVKNLAFEIEAVNQDNALKWSTTSGTPLNVKVRVRNKDEPSLLQRGTMPVPRIGISAPEKLALVSSNQTILSFSVYLQDEVKKKEEQKRHSAFKIFNIGNCLGTYSDDEGPYLPSSSNQNASASDNTIISSTGILKKRESRVLITSNTVHRNKKRFFGKCKPGGCLDPPYGEDKYSYGLSKTEHHENLQVELNEIEDNKQTSKPGHRWRYCIKQRSKCYTKLMVQRPLCSGTSYSKEASSFQGTLHCIDFVGLHNLLVTGGRLDSPVSEEKHPYSLPNTDYQEKIKLKLSETSDNSTKSRKKTPERSREHELFIQVTTKDEGDPNKLTDIYTRTSEENSLKLKYSNSIITYPTDMPSKERIYEQIPTDTLRQSYENPKSYFVPSKDVKRYKEDERRHVKRLSMDQLSRSSKVTANDMTDRSKNFETISKESNIPQNTKGSKDTVKDKTNLTELQQNDIELAPKISVEKYETTMLTQLPAHVATTSEDLDILRASESRPTENDISNLKLQQQIKSTIGVRKSDMNKTENLQDDINIAGMQLKQDIPSTKITSREISSKFSPQESNNNQTKDFQYDVELLAKQDIPLTRYTGKEAMSTLSTKTTYNNKTENLEDSINTAKIQIKEDKPLTRGFSGESMSKLSPSKAPYSSHTRILDSQNAQNQEQVDVEEQPMPALESFVNTVIQTPTNFNQEKINGNKTDDEMLHYKKTEVTDAVTRNLTTVVTEKQSVPSKDKPNVLTNSLMREKDIVSLSNPEGHPECRNVSPIYISSTENIEFDISSSHSIDFKNELSSPGKTNSLLDSSKQKDNWLSAASNNIKETGDLIDINLTSELEQRKASAIFQKKTFVTKQDSNIHNDDISKATPLKRNTFTIIGSDISLQKSEEIEEMPEDIPNVHLKISDKAKSASVGKTRGNNDILDDINKKSEDKIHATYGNNTIKKIKGGNLKNMSSKITGYTTPVFDEQASIKGESLDRKMSANIFISDVDKSFKQKNVSDQTNYHQTEIAKGVEPARIFQSLQIEPLDTKDQVEYSRSKDISGHPKNTVGEIIPTTIIDSKSVLDGAMSNKIELLEEYSELRLDSLQRSIPKKEQKGHKTMYDAEAASTTRNYDKLEDVGIDNENSIYNNGKSIIETLQKPTTKNVKEKFYEIPEDDNLVSMRPTSDKVDHLDENFTNIKNKIYNTSGIGSTQNLLPKNDRDLHSVMTGKIHDKTEHKDQMYIKPDSENTKQENAQNLYAQLADDSKDVSSGQPFDKSTFLDTGNNEPTHKFISERIRDLHSVMTGKIHDKTELIDQTYIELDSAKFKTSASNILLGNKLENIQDLHAQTIDDIKEFPFDQTYDKNAFLDQKNNESTQKSVPKHVRDLHLGVTHQIHSNIELKDQKWLDLDNKNVPSEQIFDKGVFLDTENNEPTQKSIPEHLKDLHSEITNQIPENVEVKSKIYNDLDNLKHSDAAKDDSVKMKLDNVKEFHEQTACHNEFVTSDQNVKNSAFLDTQNIQTIQKVIPEHVQNLQSGMIGKIYNKTELKENMKLDNTKYITSTDEFSQKTKRENTQNVYASFPDDNKAVFSDHDAEHIQDWHSGMTDEIREVTELKSQINDGQANLKYNDSDIDDSLKNKLENVHDFNPQTAYYNEFITTDKNDKYSAFLDIQSIDPTQKLIPEHVRDLHPAMSDKSHDKTELNDRIYNETDKFKYSESAKDKFEITSETAEDLHSHTTDNIKYVPFGIKYEKSTFSNRDHNEPTQNVLLEHNRDFIDKINDKAKLNYQQYNKLNKFIYNDLPIDDLLNHAQTADQNDYFISDQKHNKKAFRDPDSNKPQNETEKSDIVDHDVSSRKYHEQIELAENLIEDNNEFKEKSRSASKTSSPFSGYSGLISEVLSNISENTEGEEKQLTQIKNAEENSNRLEDFAVSDTKAYRDDEMINNKLAKNVGKSGLLARPSENIDSSYEIGDSSYKVPLNNLAKSFTSTLEKSGENMHKETVAKAFESIQIAHSSDKLRQLYDDYQTKKLNIVREDLYSTTNITNQSSEYQASKNFASINDSVELNDDDFVITHNVEPTLVKQNERRSVERQSQLHSTVNEPKISGAETSRLKKDTVYLDMSFYSYMNDNYQRVVQTHSRQIEQHRPHDGTVTVVKTLIRHGNEIRIPVDKENDISLNILDKDVRISNKCGTIGSPIKHTREKHLVDLAKRHDDVINKNLALIYEHELIPLHNVIKDLAQEVNTLSTQQERLQVRIRNAKRTKSLRLIPVVKRCGCRRN